MCIEPPYIPFYIPYRMSDEEFRLEVLKAEQEHAEWLGRQNAYCGFCSNKPVKCLVCGKNNKSMIF